MKYINLKLKTEHKLKLKILPQNIAKVEVKAVLRPQLCVLKIQGYVLTTELIV